MSTNLDERSRAKATCDLGHEVEVFMADGVVVAQVHQNLELIIDPLSGQVRQDKCPACTAAAKRLVRSRDWRW
jgi:hypothetical protein